MYVASYTSHKVQEATRSAVRELGYQDVKPEQMKVVEAYVQGRGVFADWLRKELVLRLPSYRILVWLSHTPIARGRLFRVRLGCGLARLPINRTCSGWGEYA